jgi:hypothetical protein
MKHVIPALQSLLLQMIFVAAANAGHPGSICHRGMGEEICAADSVVPSSVDTAAHLAFNGKLLLKDDFNTIQEYRTDFQTVQEGWKVKVWHAGFKPTDEGLQSVWVTGHNPVIVYEGSFHDVVVELEFRFHQEQDPARNSYCRINPMSRELDPRAYAISAWANINGKSRSYGMVLEYDVWEGGPIGVAVQPGSFEPDRWYTMRLEVVGDDARVSCNGMVVTGNYRKFGLPKNWLAIGVGKGTHELRKLRVYEAVQNPSWVRPDPRAKPYTAIEAMPAREKLSQSAQDKIRKIPLVFDGKTLDGWIQAPTAPITIAQEDVVDPVILAKRISVHAEPVSRFFCERLDSSARTAIQALLAGEEDPKKTVSPLAKGMNAVLPVGTILYEEKRFQGFPLRHKTLELLQIHPQGVELARLNRLLLEDVYGEVLRKSPDASWVVNDGILKSTGAGRGVIYTEKDYTSFRLVFQVRQSSGNHFPGVLIFCQRPPKGELGMDALGGIQFGVPNGSHWDYRPGINRAGDHFTRPLKIRFNPQEWAQVEILVNTQKGIVKMAVAQPVGTRPLEVLDFLDSTAVRAGPIALQMHNALLFDEYKDIRVEVDPVEKKLITLE